MHMLLSWHLQANALYERAHIGDQFVIYACITVEHAVNMHALIVQNKSRSRSAD